MSRRLGQPAGDLPDGLRVRNRVQPSLEKYFAFSETQISITTRVIPCPQEGRIAIVTDVGAGCGGRGSAGRVHELQGELIS